MTFDDEFFKEFPSLKGKITVVNGTYLEAFRKNTFDKQKSNELVKEAIEKAIDEYEQKVKEFILENWACCGCGLCMTQKQAINLLLGGRK